MSYVFVRFCIDRPRSLFSYLVVGQLRLLSSTVITSLGGAGRSASRLRLCPLYVASRFSTLDQNYPRKHDRCFCVSMIEIQHPHWLTAAILDSENLFLFYYVIDHGGNTKFPACAVDKAGPA